VLLMPMDCDSLAYVAGLDVFLDTLRHTMPKVLAANCIQGARGPEVSSLRVVMVRSHDFLNDLMRVYMRDHHTWVNLF